MKAVRFFRSEMDMFMVSQVKKFAGSISAEHGIGMLKKRTAGFFKRSKSIGNHAKDKKSLILVVF